MTTKTIKAISVSPPSRSRSSDTSTRPGAHSGTYSNRVPELSEAPPLVTSAEEIVEFLKRLSAIEHYTPRAGRELLAAEDAARRDYVEKRGRKWRMKELGKDKLREAMGTTSDSDRITWRIYTRNRLALKEFQARANINSQNKEQRVQQEDVIAILSDMVDYDVYKVFAGIAVELGITLHDAMQRLARNLAPDKLAGAPRDWMFSALFAA